MALDNFRAQQITWDRASRKIYEDIRANESDARGRKLVVQVTNDGVVETLSGVTLILRWKSKNGTGKGYDNFTVLDASKGLFELYYTTGMLSNVGVLEAFLELNDATGRVISEPFNITVTRGVDDSAIEGSDSFTALLGAMVNINKNTEEVGKLNKRIDNIIATPTTVSEQEIIDARQGETSLGKNISKIKNGILATPLKSDLKNLITNGDFSNGQVGWSLIGDMSPIIENNTLTFRVSKRFDRIQKQIQANAGDVVYRQAQVRATSPNVGIGDTSTSFSTHSGSGFFETLRSIQQETLANRYLSIVDSGVGGFADISVKNALAINLTKVFGKGEEPTISEMESALSVYDDGWFDDVGSGSAAYGRLLNERLERINVNVEGLVSAQTDEIYVKDWRFGGLNTDGTENTLDIRATSNFIKVLDGTVVKSEGDCEFALHYFTIENKTHSKYDVAYAKERVIEENCYIKIIVKHVDGRKITSIPTITSNITVKKPNEKTSTNYVSKSRKLLHKFPGTYGQGITMVGDELWGFLGNASDNQTGFVNAGRFKLDYETNTATLVGSFSQNWGHCNTVDYKKETDTLILGSGTGLNGTDGYGDYYDYKGIFLIPNATALKSVTTAPLADYATIIETGSDIPGRQIQVVWGEDNNGKHNICYVLSNNGTSKSDTSKEISDMFINKVILGQGTNNFGKGNFKTGKTGLEYNGTYKVVASYFGKSIYSPYECTQDAVFYNGKIFTGMGHDGIWVAEITLLENGTFEMLKTRERKWYMDSGNEISLITQALTIHNDKLYVRVWEAEKQSVALHVYEI